MKLFKKILKPKNEDSLQKLIRREKEHDEKCRSKDYYWSDEAKTIGKQLHHDQKEYIKNHPEDFEIVGASLHKQLWYSIQNTTPSEREILRLTGEGKYYEDQEKYEQAISLYKQAEDQTMFVCGDEINKMIEDYGPGDYLYLSVIRQRIGVCERKLKKL